MTDQQLKTLRAPFKADEIEWVISATNKEKTQGYAAPYVDSRAIQERLDTVLGIHCWQDHFLTIPASAKEPSAHICEISIKTDDMPEWVTKSDGAGSTDIEPIKGGLSGAFKRAGSMWGVGRYLYDMKGTWVPIEAKGRSYVVTDAGLNSLANFYNNKVSKMFGALPSGTQINKAQPEQPAYQPQAAQTAQSRQPAPVSRQAPAQQAAPVAKNQAPAQVQEFYQVRDAKTTRGGNGTQTFVVLQKSTGEQINGYIKGEAGLQAGQKLVNLQVVTRNDPNFGDYNIIHGYELAA